ncbi:MAG: hypothetical protein WC156_13765 [Pedobacter sp.]|jgi:hypothetical protein
MLQEMGAEIYQTWSEQQRREEIGRLVQGYQTGLPLAVMCMIAASIAGSPAKAKKHLKVLMTLKERKAAVAKVADTGDDHLLARSFLL